MIAIPDLLIQSLEKVWITFTHNWPFLLASVIISVALRLYINPEKVSQFLIRYRRVGVLGATAAAVTTPFCSCGTTAVILGMIASTIPWAPIVAFMVASPLTSPEGLVYSAGLFGWPFAIAFYVSSILLGLMGGAAAEFFESRGWLANQVRFSMQAAPAAAQETKPLARASSAACACEPAGLPLARPAKVLHNLRPARPVWAAQSVLAAQPVLAESSGLALETCCGPAVEAPAAACGCGSAPAAQPPAACGCGAQSTAPAPLPATCGCGGSAAQTRPAAGNEPAPQDGRADASSAAARPPVTVRRWIEEIYRTGKQLMVMFLGFAFIGYLLNGLIPPAWVSAIFGQGNIYSVPLAATLGLPLYINSEGSLPLVRALIDGGMSQGAALAFLITGAGTSVGAVAGALTIARWRVLALVVGTLWVGAVIMGALYNFALTLHLF